MYAELVGLDLFWAAGWTAEMKSGKNGLFVAFLWLLAARCLGGETATAVATVTGGLVSSITVTSGGAGYTVEPLVTVADGGGSGASAKAVLSNGRIDFIIILSAGSGYSRLPEIIISPPSIVEVGISPAFVVYGEDGSNVSIETTTGLTSGWTVLTNLVAKRAGAIFSGSDIAENSRFYRIKTYDSGNPGSGNENLRATATATIRAGFVAGVSLVNQGSGYIAEPKVNLVGGGGFGATARAFLSGGKVLSVVVLTAGNSYTSPPGVEIEPPPMPTRISVGLGKSLRATGQPWSKLIIENSMTRNGSWIAFTNLALLSSGVSMIDLIPGLENRFYRIAEVVPPGTAGFVWINPGSFIMGSPETEAGRNALSKWEEIQHQVTITRGFWMSDHEVTQGEYRAVMGVNPNTLRNDNFPATNVKWGDAVRYCDILTNRERLANRINGQQVYRLPTEAEWEYACRAGSTDARYGNLGEIAWFTTAEESSLRSVRTKKPNALGLYDMLGNAWEWCSDWWWDYPAFAVTDPTGPLNPIGNASVKIVRGAPWNFQFGNLRSAGRFKMPPDTAQSYMGFRVVLSDVW